MFFHFLPFLLFFGLLCPKRREERCEERHEEHCR